MTRGHAFTQGDVQGRMHSMPLRLQHPSLADTSIVSSTAYIDRMSLFVQGTCLEVPANDAGVPTAQQGFAAVVYGKGLHIGPIGVWSLARCLVCEHMAATHAPQIPAVHVSTRRLPWTVKDTVACRYPGR
jgi:hypothetical protein